MDLAAEGLETLRNCRFPVYAVPPSRWDGDVMVGGATGNGVPVAIDIRYDEDLLIDKPSRRISIASRGLLEPIERSPAESFLLWEHSYRTNVVNFVENIERGRLAERPVIGSERFNADMIDGKLVPKIVHLPSAGPRRLADAIPFRDGFHIERVAFEHVPELGLYRIQMPDVEVLLLAWRFEDAFLAEFISSVDPVMETKGLYEEIEGAQYAAWEKIKQRKR